MSDSILFRNVRVFSGTGDALSPPTDVLVEGRTIARIGAGGAGEAATAIQGNGRTLMPGLIDAHWHATLAALPLQTGLTADIGYIQILAGREAHRTLMRGFTSVRDVAGPTFGLKRAIDERIVRGPRIWPSGAMISQTGGHGDFRSRAEIPAPRCAQLHYTEQVGAMAIADSPDEVRKRTREQLMLGASHIKLAAGGGVTSGYDPLDVTQYTQAEIRAAVEAAENWNTYVTVHAYTPRAISIAIAAGVRCVEHGQLADDATAALMAERGVWWCLQPFLDDEDAIPFPPGSASRAKQLEMIAGTDTAYELAKKHGVQTAWGTDTLFDPRLADRQGAQLAKLARWYTPAQALRMATAGNAELLALSGNRNPYPGKLGVVEEGALADLILVDGNPLDDLSLIANPSEKFLTIVKDGVIEKDDTAKKPVI